MDVASHKKLNHEPRKKREEEQPPDVKHKNEEDEATLQARGNC